MIPRLHELIVRHDVDVYLSGHDHHLELISFEDRQPEQPIFVISGAGSTLRTMLPRSRTGLPTLFPADAKSFLGFAVVEFERDAASVRFYDAKAKARSGVFTFRKPIVELAPRAPL